MNFFYFISLQTESGIMEPDYMSKRRREAIIEFLSMVHRYELSTVKSWTGNCNTMTKKEVFAELKILHRMEHALLKLCICRYIMTEDRQIDRVSRSYYRDCNYDDSLYLRVNIIQKRLFTTVFGMILNDAHCQYKAKIVQNELEKCTCLDEEFISSWFGSWSSIVEKDFDNKLTSYAESIMGERLMVRINKAMPWLFHYFMDVDIIPMD